MERFLTTILLCVAIILIAFGIHTNNLIIEGVGGFFAGIYNAMLYKVLRKK
jgi:hypothetical protein